MRERIEEIVGDNEIYKARRGEFETGEKIPFEVSPTPLVLTKEQKRELEDVGNDIVAYFGSINELYATDSEIREVLDTGKPEVFLVQKPMKYLFVRPDIIITPEGFRICEIETSPFGLALADILNTAYRKEGFDTLVTEDALSKLVHANTPVEGRIIFSSKTEAYSGQMDFLAERVFSGDERRWTAEKVNDVDQKSTEAVYRGFYLHEYLQDPSVGTFLEHHIKDRKEILPSITPHMEEKAILAFIWDKRFETHLKTQLGTAVFAHLREIIPPNWIVGQEKYFAPGLPGNMTSSIGLANLSRSKRAFVLKSSGFAGASSWGEGVDFLHKKSSTEATELLSLVHQDHTSLHVVQEFKKGEVRKVDYTNKNGQVVQMSARVRLTPYFSAVSGDEGRLIAIKATARENTDYIHGSSDSINTAVS